MAQNIEMQCKQSDGSYETLLPKSQVSLLEINNTDLGNHLGGNTTVEGALDYLSRMYAYWWKRDIITPVYKLVETGSQWFISLGKQNWDSNSGSWYYGSFSWAGIDNLTIKSDGTIETREGWTFYTTSFTCDKTDDFYSTYTSNNPNTITKRYVRYGDTIYTSSSANSRAMLYATSEGASGYYLEVKSYNTSYNCVTVTTALDHNEYETDYVYSFSRDAYPDSGTVGNYTYTYLGIPFENARNDGPK